ncbi:hypothetical protein OOU_Y34scaffold01147g5 [Pyricularia oryzae Y34]|uniref:Uncharacterized protein n=2 Tax=Pyricularia oryzae TaxID=318829 RepID=A0AA97PFA3_PYRO3|nr:hypothetical protein OOU_Y34scaffold01147g5 [Pyricularia oryzae Y34]
MAYKNAAQDGKRTVCKNDDFGKSNFSD